MREFIELISSLKFGNKDEWKSFQKGIVISTLSYIELTSFLLNERQYSFVLGGRFTQDCLENLFSVLRMKNSTLNAVQLKNNLKLTTISHYMRSISCGNYNDDRVFTRFSREYSKL